ncbi:PUA-like domain-containing protein [Entophlyctis helioformis]|nr:PUA-like domain-containing protein [Entophlyctis helioformis]
MKAEPDTRLVNSVDVRFSIDDLAAAGTSSWEGVRNYEARNIMRDGMRVDDLVLFYHSNCKVPGVAGIARVCRNAYVDHTAFDVSHPYYDAKSDPANPRWFMVDVEFVRKLDRLVPLKELQSLKSQPALSGMALLTRGRLSVQPVSAAAYEFIVELSKTSPAAPE